MDIAGNTAHALRFACPTRFSFVSIEIGNLVWRDVFVRRAFEEIFGFGKVGREVGISVVEQVVQAEVVFSVVPSQPAGNPRSGVA